MATRYIVIVSQPGTEAASNARAHAERSGLVLVTSTPNASVLVDPTGSCVRMGDRNGLIIGHLFTSEAKPKRVKNLTPAASDAITKSNLKSLLQSHWGGYVAIRHDPSTGDVSVLRDPSGTMPCLYLKRDDFNVVASDMETLLSCGMPTPRIDWDYMARYFLAHSLRSEQTCLKGISELLPGTCLHISARSTFVTEAWSPWDYTDSLVVPDYRESIDELRDTTLGCLEAWGSCFQHILLGVSGGLDSSIVAAGLVGHTKLTCLTMSTAEPFGDERRYARQLTTALGVPLIEAFYNFDEVDLKQPTSSHLPLPIGNPIAQTSNRRKLTIANEQNVDAFFSGAGGDNVFCYILSAAPLLDCVQANGLGSDSWRAMADICRLTGCSIWDVIAMAARRKVSGGPAYRWRPTPLFLNPRRARNWNDLQHPWLTAPKGSAIGKAVHIAGILRMQVAPDIFSRTGTATQVLPLMSQPITQMCLKIPTWHWIKGGRNRALARDAFAYHLPEAIVKRTSKGGPGSFAYALIDRNRHLVRQQLLDGLLAQHGLLDIDTLTPVLRSERPLQQPDRMRLSELIEAEAWARAWAS